MIPKISLFVYRLKCLQPEKPMPFCIPNIEWEILVKQGKLNILRLQMLTLFVSLICTWKCMFSFRTAWIFVVFMIWRWVSIECHSIHFLCILYGFYFSLQDLLRFDGAFFHKTMEKFEIANDEQIKTLNSILEPIFIFT